MFYVDLAALPRFTTVFLWVFFPNNVGRSKKILCCTIFVKNNRCSCFQLNWAMGSFATFCTKSQSSYLHMIIPTILKNLGFILKCQCSSRVTVCTYLHKNVPKIFMLLQATLLFIISGVFDGISPFGPTGSIVCTIVIATLFTALEGKKGI